MLSLSGLSTSLRSCMYAVADVDFQIFASLYSIKSAVLYEYKFTIR